MEIKQNTKDRILEEAINLFSIKGYDGVSIRDISKAVGIKESSIYNHFSSKEEILDTIINNFITAVGNTIFDIHSISSLIEGRKLREVLECLSLEFNKKITSQIYKSWKIIYMEQFKNKSARDFVLNEIMKRTRIFYKALFKEMQEKALLKDTNAEMLGELCHYSFLMLSWERMLVTADSGDTNEIDKSRKAILDYLCNYKE
ncbi:TetR/AcrR family transcriptional regulator [Desnuesiella massiliensis]|uniref:TetR/AcrR family transcriptional regulator n=1 Tax=Desnuesiella massiliensis TaxID=1650662 RepID=UPI0006E2F74F|nr:TetR/AcrR family transcriptional regulator [Desnuesiella massiliensis]